MNRRSIFKLLAGAACAAAMEITGIIPSLPKEAKWVINPEWLSAEYEDVVTLVSTLPVVKHREVEDKESVWYTLKVKRGVQRDTPVSLTVSKSPPKALPDAAPTRYRFANGEYQRVPNYILES